MDWKHIHFYTYFIIAILFGLNKGDLYNIHQNIKTKILRYTLSFSIADATVLCQMAIVYVSYFHLHV